MPVDIALHPVGNPIQGNHPPAPSVPVISQQTGLAEATPSADLVVPATGAVLCLVATAKLRVDIELVGGPALDPATSALVLPTDQVRQFYLRQGTYRLQTAVYA